MSVCARHVCFSVFVFVIRCLFVNMHVLSCPPPPPVGDIRTLQWDTDPSVLQLQADSELGYSFLLSSCSLLKHFIKITCKTSYLAPHVILKNLSTLSTKIFNGLM